MITIKIVLF